MFRDPVRFAIAFVAFFLLFFSFAHRWKGEDGYGWEATVDGDAKGYYAPLPAVLIYHDPTFKFFSQPENETVARYYNERFRVRTDEGTVHKNYAGVAVMQLPFFMAGHGLALLTNEPANGYSWPYMLMLILGSVTYCVAGLWMVAQLLIGFGISHRIAAMVLLLISIGTNLLYYTAIHAAMPHVYSFFLIACFAYLMRGFFMHQQSRLLLCASMVFGLIVLVRPVNALVLAAVPFLAPSSAVLFQSFRWLLQRKATMLLAIIPAVLVVSVQLLFYKIQTGHWFVWSYGNEGFRFDDPHIWDVLFSWKKGLFVYTPVMLFSFAGIGMMYRSHRWAGGMYLLFILLTLYVISSWWSWFYGDGYGLRAFVDFYPLMAVPMAFALNGLFKLNFKISLPLLLLLPLFLLLSVVQNYQYRYRIIHPAEMNFDKYRYVFLKTDASYRDVIGGDNEYIYPRLSELPAASWFNDFEGSAEGWAGEGGKDSQQPFSGKRTDQFHSEREWGTTLTIAERDLPNASGNLFAVVTYQRYQHEPGACNKVYLACAVDDSTDKNISWKGFRSNEYPIETTGKWMSAEARFRLPENISPGDKLKIYIWNQEKKRFEVDDVRVEVFEMINDR